MNEETIIAVCSMHLEHEPEFGMTFGLVAELVDEDAAEVETAGVMLCLIKLKRLHHVQQQQGSRRYQTLLQSSATPWWVSLNKRRSVRSVMLPVESF